MTVPMNGAESLVHTLVGAGVDVCFTNPGTSEMHFVAALDRVPGMRCVLGLFEGVVTGMADGYGRMADKPAATLLHLGPGLGNGIANLHNARRAGTPIVNIVGEHATYHIKNDAPLTSDLEGIARPVSAWLRTSLSARSIAADAAEAVAAAQVPPGRIATLVLPGDTAWDPSDGPAPALPRPGRSLVPRAAIESAAAALASDAPVGIVLGGTALRAGPLLDAGRIAKKTGARLLAQSASARWQRGAGRVPVERIAYPVDVAMRQLAGLEHLLLIGAPPPVAFFAFPGRPGVMAPEGCVVHRLAGPGDDLAEVLARLAEALDATGVVPETQQRDGTEPPRSGPLTTSAIGAAIGALIPENAIVVDESVTTGRAFGAATAGSAPHDWLFLTGGAIGFGLPAATGAAIACPDRKVLCLEGDGSAMYTLQALWTQAREELDVVNVVFANRGYQILKGELANVGAGNPGRKALDMLEVDRPDLDFVALATGMGVPASRAETAGDFSEQLARALAEPGPHLIEAMVA